ncbi:cupin domain-containing protein [Stappia sp. F7233]|uniref:Cupin domain-containing protein n=1 Tax=Stappia albiluteola TaxID=2758565 RepID=A0A839AC24_9HYPH|nr:ChrR family anti-sigma-E factor [Stappia albiluteola]MBA5776437.1 cupin domain-containing protein [Stappia albiluteola]
MAEEAPDFDSLLASYVAGSLVEPARVLVRSYLELNRENREFVRGLESMAGEMLDDIEPQPLEARNERLASILALEPEQLRDRKRGPEVGKDDLLPPSLRNFLGRGLNDLSWRTRLPGLKEHRLGEIDGCSVSLLWIRAGQAMPTHTHSGKELTLVLDGGFSDGIGHYLRGDVSFADDTVDHRPVADDDGDCLCFVVTEGDLRLTGPIGRFFAPFVRG